MRQRTSRYIERGPAGAKAKRLNGFECQLCDALGKPPHAFTKLNGEPFVEAHHVLPVSKLEPGSLGLANIMTVCANHHRPLHVGGLEVSILAEVFALTLEGRHIEVPRARL